MGVLVYQDPQPSELGITIFHLVRNKFNGDIRKAIKGLIFEIGYVKCFDSLKRYHPFTGYRELFEFPSGCYVDSKKVQGPKEYVNPFKIPFEFPNILWVYMLEPTHLCVCLKNSNAFSFREVGFVPWKDDEFLKEENKYWVKTEQQSTILPQVIPGITNLGISDNKTLQNSPGSLPPNRESKSQLVLPKFANIGK